MAEEVRREVPLRNKGADTHQAGLLPTCPQREGASDSDGFILVAVLFVLAALAALVGAFAVYASATAVSARVGEGRLQSDALITSALELTASRLIGLDDSHRPSSGAFRFQLGRAKVEVEFRTEGARVDLNFASKPLLAGLFVTLGAKQEDADFAADRIVGWRKKNDVPNRNPEADLYKDAGLKYTPRQAPFQNVAELNFLAGLSPELVERALPFVTVFNGRAEIDANEAEPEVIAALPHMTPDLAAAIVKQRDPRNPSAVVSLLGAAASSVAIGGRSAIRGVVHVILSSGIKVNAEAVIVVQESAAQPYRILAWRDDYGGAF